MIGTGTSADIAERAARRFDKARRLTEGTFLVAGGGIGMGLGLSLSDLYADGEIGLPLALLLVAGLMAFTVMYMRLVRAGMQGRAPVGELVLSAVLAAALSAVVGKHPLWVLLGPFWASVAALCLPGLRRIAAICAGTGAVLASYTVVAAGDRAHWYMWPTMFVLLSLVSGVMVAANMAQKWLWDVMQEAHAAREAQARLAVTEERLRFARDLHDLLGHNLSLIAVKSELAIRMTPTDPDRARAEMADVRQAARDALREVRAAVRGYRVVELDAELASIRAVLEAAGVRCTVPQDPGGLPPEIGGVLAWVVREGATNVLKHSDARRCDITLARYDGSVVLEMVNDGARPAAAGHGTGLTGLTERLAAVGGGLTAEHTGHGRFLLRAAVPLPEPVSGGEPLRSVA
ncbi:two-component system, NarL family, sensor histidine kinase DesK [Thermomonospora echinospora]|uniref:Two-component system, NarL family, sensor histidine kinase DesK n=1 Tax=Thermomonospora echinospora TaxID=1992 RepID=A0A1H5SIN7_9ACTN|nr:sensor histidine kinase [Thermomonospora echinospora]SEF50489.1 two-component system, NarL family, sensor histidine kinase DesK [Thermomonospora echinospora]